MARIKECCDNNYVHTDAVDKVRKQLPKEDLLYDTAELFKIFGDSTRIRILTVLLNAELCVCDVCNLLLMTKSAVSHQLRILRQAKLVKCRRQGKEVYYTLADDHVAKIIDIALEHLCE